MQPSEPSNRPNSWKTPLNSAQMFGRLRTVADGRMPPTVRRNSQLVRLGAAVWWPRIATEASLATRFPLGS